MQFSYASFYFIINHIIKKVNFFSQKKRNFLLFHTRGGTRKNTGGNAGCFCGADETPAPHERPRKACGTERGRVAFPREKVTAAGTGRTAARKDTAAGTGRTNRAAAGTKNAAGTAVSRSRRVLFAEYNVFARFLRYGMPKNEPGKALKAMFWCVGRTVF